ncbi:MAG: hypothetical protein JNK85_25260 [Verrucomicrobiales bacterium]|nr:hypothetical protein [Verrucomicrobiales bacterium]
MSKEPHQLAHQRLVALAQERRRVAEKLPPLGAFARQRLLTEAERLQKESPRLSESSSAGAPKGNVWGAWLTWLGVAAAAAVLILVIRLADSGPTPGPVSVASATKSEMERAALPADLQSDASTAAAAVGGGDIAAAPPPVLASPAEGNEFASAPTSADLSPTVPSTPALDHAMPSAGRQGLMLRSAQRIRRRYEGVTSHGSAPPFLRSFEVTQRGYLLNLREPDGSSYTGRVTQLPRRTGQTGPMEWSFEGKGLQQGRSETVWIVGNFQDKSGVAGPSSTPPVLDATLTATIQIGGTNLFELRATPSDP